MSTEDVIDSFTGTFGFLSNFHKSTIFVNGKKYTSVEHAYQAHKTLDEAAHEAIRTASSPGEAKKLGRCVALRKDWEDVKIDLMRSFLEKKFESPFLRAMLLETGDVQLVEGNTWGDTFWGVCRGTGTNWLGVLLMQLRDKIREEATNDLHA